MLQEWVMPVYMFPFLTSLLCVNIIGSCAVSRSDVLVLQQWDFVDSLWQDEYMLVLFYAPWCGYCKKVAPEFERAAAQLKGSLTLAKLDCTVNAKTCERFGVKGYPTLKIFHSGQEASVYDGPRTAEAIVSYMQKHASPSSTPLDSQDQLHAFIHHSDASVVGFFSISSISQVTEFVQAATAMRDSFRFAHTTDPSVGLQYGAETGCVLLFRPPRLNSTFEEMVVKYSGPISVPALRKFINNNIFGICPHLTRVNRDKMKGRDLLTAYYDVDYISNPKGSNYWRNRLIKVAAPFRAQGLSLAIASRQEFQRELREEFALGLSDGGEFPMVTIRTRQGHKYSMREEFTRDGKALHRFLEDYFAGRLKRYFKSQPAPEVNDGPVKLVVAETFDEIVHDPEKHVLIEFYAPWCSHCKTLEAKYAELGEQLRSDSNVVIAKMDATANDIPQEYDIHGFPTIYFCPAGKKEDPVRYEGAYEVKELLKFVRRESTQQPLVLGCREEL